MNWNEKGPAQLQPVLSNCGQNQRSWAVNEGACTYTRLDQYAKF